MKARRLLVDYDLAVPPIWVGRYTCNNAYKDRNWTWYKDGKSNTVNAPHVTIAFDLGHEVLENGDWVGFHVSYPLSGGTKNGRFNFEITAANKVKFKNITKTNLTANEMIEVESLRPLWATFEAFAICFHKAAMGV